MTQDFVIACVAAPIRSNCAMSIATLNRFYTLTTPFWLSRILRSVAATCHWRWIFVADSPSSRSGAARHACNPVASPPSWRLKASPKASGGAPFHLKGDAMSSPNEWYWTLRWKKRSAAQLREHPLCARCASKGRVTVAKVADHIVPHKGDWNLFCLGELQSLCKNCHVSGKQSEERLGYSKEIDASGWPKDPRHPAYRGRPV